MTLRFDAERAIEFLRWLYPAGPWVISAIEVDQRGITTATFGPERERELRAFLSAHEQRNIYYDVNARRDGVNPSKKAYKVDIATVPFLHVDVDPRAGEPLADERERIRALLANPAQFGFPPPSAIIFSGGGYNALWRLETPHPIEGDDEDTRTTNAENVERYNRTFQIALDGGDHCFNIDRILRLPGTINWPDAKKRGKGRTPMQAAVVYVDAVAYPIELFRPTDPIQSRSTTIGDDVRGGGIKIEISGNVARLASVDDLPSHVPLWVKVLIVQGMNPEAPDKYKSRSESLYACVCELVRCGISDDTIYAIITDPDFAISASVLDKGSGRDRYAKKQIKSARENAIDPVLAEFNDRHAVIHNYGGRCLVIEEDEDPVFRGRSRITKQTFADFANRYINRQVRIGVDPKSKEAITVPAGTWWLKHEHRREYRTMTFSPGHDVPGAFNLWKGFAVDPKEGTCHHGFLEHIRLIICAGDQALYDYLVKWMARCVQRPAEQGEVAVVLRGAMGTGKGVFCREFGALWGRHYLQISESRHLVGNFNAHLRDCVVLFADEAFFAGDRKHASNLKALITEDRIVIESKGVDAIDYPNCLHIIMASNDDWVIPAGPEERRYLVLDVSDEHKQDVETYFPTLRKSMEENSQEGRRNLLHYLQTYDLTGFEVRRVPKTKALHEQKLMSLSSEQEWWFKKLEDGFLLASHHTWTAPITKAALVEDYLTYAQRLGVPRRTSETVLARFLRKVLPASKTAGGIRDVFFDGGARNRRDRVVLYQLPPLEDCRRRWEELIGGTRLDWPDTTIKDEHPNAPGNHHEIDKPSPF